MCDGIYRKVKVYLRNKSKMTFYVTEGRIYEIKASSGQRLKVKYYYYDHISPQEPHTGEYTINGTNAASQFMMLRSANGETAEAPIDVFYDPNNPEKHFTDPENKEISKISSSEIGLGIFIAFAAFLYIIIKVE